MLIYGILKFPFLKYQGLSFVSSMSRRKVFGNPTPSTSNKRLRTSPLEISSENSHSGEVSKYFSNDSKDPTEPVKIPEKIIDLQNELVKNLKALNLISGQVKYLYNPLEYASEPNHNFIKKYCNTTKKILFVGLNPGPNGMCQTGIPFGDPKWVRDWLKIDGQVFKPEIECPDRKIYGISSPKLEPSGDRLWTYFSKLSITPETFFKHSFVFNFCPVAFMEANGRNVTPEDFTDSKARVELEQVCYNWYLGLITILKPEIVISIGKYAEKKTNDLFKARGVQNILVLYMPHPSPRAPGDWFRKAEDFLNKHNLKQYFINNQN